MIICTMLIVYRLARALTSTTGISLRLGSNLYYKVIEILVELSTLYVVALVVNIPFIMMNDPYGAYPQAVLDSVTVSWRFFADKKTVLLGFGVGNGADFDSTSRSV